MLRGALCVVAGIDEEGWDAARTLVDQWADSGGDGHGGGGVAQCGGAAGRRGRGHLVAAGGIRACAELLVSCNPHAASVVQEILNCSDERTHHALIALEVASKNDFSIVEQFRTGVDKSSKSPDQSATSSRYQVKKDSFHVHRFLTPLWQIFAGMISKNRILFPGYAIASNGHS